MTQRRNVRRAKRLALSLLLFVLMLAATAVFGAWLYLRASLPQLDGSLVTGGVTEPASILRDAAGSVTVQGASRLDVAYATGIAHAQDRYFQMDLLRRSSAGELAAVFGEIALPLDRRNRPHGFRARAEAAYARMPENDRMLLQAYADGVNAGLQGLKARPFEYVLLQQAPQPWRPFDTLLVIGSMYFDLQGNELKRVLGRSILRDTVPDDLLAMLTLPSSHWDAPLDGRHPPDASFMLAGGRPDWLDEPVDASAAGGIFPPSSSVGSNAWAVDGQRGADGRARLANDMHLRLGLPSVWYRLTLEFPDARGGTRRVTGVSLPGAPVVVAGSNGDVAWGFTNSYGRYFDLIELEVDPADPRRYRDAAGAWRQADERTEMLAVSGGQAVALPVRMTQWGPMIEADGKTYAVRWIGHLPDSADLNLIRLEDAADMPAALRVAQVAGVPTQNIVAVDRQGRIGWSLAGPLPARIDAPDGYPLRPADAAPTLARLPANDYPEVIDPSSGRLWTANSLQLGDPAGRALIGDGGADVGVRATQIRDALFAADAFDERALLAIQLDDRASWAEPWRKIALDALDEAALRERPARAEFRRILEQWNGHAAADQAGYTLVRGFQQALYDVWFAPLDRRLEARAPGVALRHASARLLPLMETLAREEAWRPTRFADWRAFMLDRVDAAIAEVTKNGVALEDARWGHYNRLDVGHPLASALPSWLRGWLTAPATPMSGDLNVPRTQGGNFGQSERLVVSPGYEESGILQLPGGASGHPLSPFFLADHEAWVKGTEPVPLLPGPPVHRLVLEPGPPH